MVVWEAIRLSGRGVSAAELAGSLGMPLASVQRAVDAMVALGLVDPVRAGRGRRVPTYRVATPELRVSVDGVAAADLDAFTARLRRSFEEALDRAASPAGVARPHARRSMLGFGHARLTAAEWSRIRSLVQTICDIVQAAAGRESPSGRRELGPGAEISPEALAAYGLLVRVEPLADLPARHPTITLAGAGDVPDPGSNGRLALSPRERQVAEALAIGMSRPEVAMRLGVSANTVATLSRRIYAKLGIRSRAELARTLVPHVG